MAVEIDLSAIEEEIETRYALAVQVVNAGHLFFSGQLSGDDFYDVIAPTFGKKLDQYIEEMDRNIEDIEEKTGLILI